MADLSKFVQELLDIELLKEKEYQDQDKIEFLKDWLKD